MASLLLTMNADDVLLIETEKEKRIQRQEDYSQSKRQMYFQNMWKTRGNRVSMQYLLLSCLTMQEKLAMIPKKNKNKNKKTSSRVRGKKSLRMNLESEMTQEDCLSCCSMSTMDVTGIWRKREKQQLRQGMESKQEEEAETDLFFSKD